jgi:hypothetical protein
MRNTIPALIALPDFNIDGVLASFVDAHGTGGHFEKLSLYSRFFWYLVHALPTIGLFLFSLSPPVCPLHHRRNGKSI